MTIEGINYSYKDTDTSVNVSYTDNGVESTTTVNTVMSNSVVDVDATELAIKTSVYGTEVPSSITPS